MRASDIWVRLDLLWQKDTTVIVALFRGPAELESIYGFEFYGLRGATGCEEGRAHGLFARLPGFLWSSGYGRRDIRAGGKVAGRSVTSGDARIPVREGCEVSGPRVFA